MQLAQPNAPIVVYKAFTDERNKIISLAAMDPSEVATSISEGKLSETTSSKETS